ncbi:alpha/beta hydrolase [Brevibacterium daeguense]|uniref:Alpha/beta hydrolase n=1 Tax=Brevibacterium daeguense TaxID=909936 RepID=A0ABP8EN68_9MICO|nr:alpha/beta hydrolase [Brevibacterium daeguense]
MDATAAPVDTPPVGSAFPPELHAGLPSGVGTGTFSTARHTTGYLSAGRSGDPVLLLIHGWPEFARSWVRVLEPLASAGFHVVAPDMRGYGTSTVHPQVGDYSTEEIVTDMIELLAHLGVSEQSRCVVVGHDHGAPIAWNIATHHPELLAGVAGVCVPYMPPGAALTDHIDRELYPAAEYPYGQWDYLIAHLSLAEKIAEEFDADVPGVIASIMRAGSPRHLERRAPNASVRSRGGWFPDGPPRREPDPRVLDDTEYEALVASLQHTGFAAANAWYRNNRANAEYAAANATGGRLTVPALFVHARYDIVCTTLTTSLPEPMRRAADDLDEAVVDAGHWVAQEKPAELVAVLSRWLRSLGLAR